MAVCVRASSDAPFSYGRYANLAYTVALIGMSAAVILKPS